MGEASSALGGAEGSSYSFTQIATFEAVTGVTDEAAYDYDEPELDRRVASRP